MIFEMQCPNCGHAWFLPSVPIDHILNAPDEFASSLKPTDGGFRNAPDEESADEPAEFEPLADEAVLFSTSGPALPVVLNLSDRQLRDALNAVSSTGSSALYLSILMFLCLAFQGFVIAVSALALLGSSGRVDLARVAGFVAIVAGALATATSAMLLGSYGSSLKEFVRSKEPDSLILSLRSGSRFWLWMAIVTTFALVLGAMALFTVLAETH